MMASPTFGENKDADDGPSILHSRRPRRISDTLNRMIRMKEARMKFRLISNILKKNEHERTPEEISTLEKHPDLVEKAEKRATMRCKLKRRVMEIEDPSDVLKEKCDQLAEAIKKAKGVCVYTGAGISTAASIPDYRGPNGVWTLLRKGQQLKPQELTDSEPTKTHMSVISLYKHGKLKHVVSQNCDGLHLRSGLSKKFLSEVHGNMYLEMCFKCKPHKEYLRLFDVTEKTSFRRHHTARNCHSCKSPLSDTIVHFGEKGHLSAPYRWKEATLAAKNCDIILCLGTSLKVLKKYACLWCMNKKPSKRPKLFIVNLQWTPKDDLATLKINGKCDDVMERVMKKLRWKIPEYTREKDPLFRMAVPLHPHEYNTVSSKQLQVPDSLKEKFYRKLLKNNSPIHQDHIPARLSTKSNCFGQSPCHESAVLHKTTSTYKKALKPSALHSESCLLSESSSQNRLDVGSNSESILICRTLSQLNSHDNDKDHSYNLLEWKSQPDFCSSFSCWPVLMVLIDHDYLPHEQFWTLIQDAGVSQYQKILDSQDVSQKDKIVTYNKCGLKTSKSVSCDCTISPLNSSNYNESTSANASRHGDHCCVCDKVPQPELAGFQETACSFDKNFGLVTYPATSAIDCKQKGLISEHEVTTDGAINKKQNKRIPGWFGKGLIVHKKRKRF